jgi:hypothetical protein
VTWQSNGEDGSGLGVYGQRFNSSAARVGFEFRVNTTTTLDQWRPAVAAFSDGGFVVAWASDSQDGSGQGVYAQCYDGSGNPADGEFLVNTTTLNDQWQPSAAAFSAGNFAVVWTSNNQDGSLEGVFGQRLMIDNLVPPAAQPLEASH